MFALVALPNFTAPSCFSEKLTAGLLYSSSVGRAVRQIAAGDHRRLLHQVVHRRRPLAGRRRVADAGDDLLAGRLGAVGGLEQRLPGVGGALLDQLQLEQARSSG